jgi:hypothetical protein
MIFVFDPILEHMPSSSEHRGLFGAAASFEAQELGLQVAPLDADRGPGTVTRAVLSHGAPLRVRVERRLPALSSFLGHIVAQDSKCPAVGKRATSTPISATRTCAVSSLTPSIVVSRRAHSSIGAKVFPTSASNVARACSNESMRPMRSVSKRGEYEARSRRISSCIMRLTRGCVRLRKPPKQSEEGGQEEELFPAVVAILQLLTHITYGRRAYLAW